MNFQSSPRSIAAVVFLASLICFHVFSTTAGAQLIKAIRLESGAASADRIVFELDSPVQTRGVSLPGANPRVYFDFAGFAPGKKVKNRIAVNGSFIKQIRHAYHLGKKKKTRVVLDLIEDRKLSIKQDFTAETNTLIITLYEAGTEPPATLSTTQPGREPSPREIVSVVPARKVTPPAVEMKKPVQQEQHIEAGRKKIQHIEKAETVAASPDKPVTAKAEPVIPAGEKKPAKSGQSATGIKSLPFIAEEPQVDSKAEPSVPALDIPAAPEPKPTPEVAGKTSPAKIKPVEVPATAKGALDKVAGQAAAPKVAAITPEPEPTPVVKAEKAVQPEAKPTLEKKETLQDAGIPSQVQTTSPEPPAVPPQDATVIQPMSEVGRKDAADKDETPILYSLEFEPKSKRGEIINFRLNGFHPPVVFGIEEDIPRIVCFFKNATPGDELQDMIGTNGKFVKNIKVGKYQNPNNIRVILELVPGNNYDLQQIFLKDEKTYMIIINKTGKQVSSKQQ